MSDDSKYSFEENAEVAKTIKKVKLDPKKSRFAQQLEVRQAANELEKYANEVHQKKLDLQQEIFELGSKFIEVIKDRTVADQKGPVAQSLEREILQKLVNFAIEVNNDPKEGEGMGSVSLLTVILKITLLMRDKNNLLEHKIYRLEQQALKLEERLKLSSASSTPAKIHE